MNKCGAYSYRDYDELCMMSGDAIKFDTDFVYYERNMPPPVDKQEMRMLSGKDEADEADPPAAGDQCHKHATLAIHTAHTLYAFE